MKHTSIVITEKNIRQIAGRLKKYFHYPRTPSTMDTIGFKCIHNFDCGWSIKPYQSIQYYYFIPENITVRDTSINIMFGDGVGISYNIGDEVKFYGSKLLTKKRWLFGSKNKFIYDSYQLIYLSDEDYKKAECDSTDYNLFDDNEYEDYEWEEDMEYDELEDYYDEGYDYFD